MTNNKEQDKSTKDEINRIVRSSPAVVQNYDEASRNGLPVLIDDLTDLIDKKVKEARIAESEIYEKWFNNDENLHIEDLIQQRLNRLKGESDGTT